MMIPCLSTPAGSCLTPKNWEEASVTEVSIALASLLIKPGLPYLKTLSRMADYAPWSGPWVLNATLPAPFVKGQVTFKSPFDGAKLSFTVNDITDIIVHLKPQKTMLPKGFYPANEAIWQQLSESTTLFVPIANLSHTSKEWVHGIHYERSLVADLYSLVTQCKAEFPGAQHLVSGDFEPTLWRRLSALGVDYFESDSFASDAFLGRVYGSEGLMDLTEKAFTMQFEVIDLDCGCPTCTQGFTRAYLHHLFEHTPLLCQRLLIQHNVHYGVHFQTQLGQ